MVHKASLADVAIRCPLTQPAAHQQTLRRSFTVGGIGLHTGEYAIVRVMPAFAGEGRYFVRVPCGTNEHEWEVEQPQERALEGEGEPAGWDGVVVATSVTMRWAGDTTVQDKLPARDLSGRRPGCARLQHRGWPQRRVQRPAVF